MNFSKKEPLVSIILPTYNRRDMLEYALLSALNQTYKNIEIIIGDNCSQDDTENFCNEWQHKDNRIKYYRQNRNIGPFANTDNLLSKISGEYFVFLNDDDWLDLDYVEQSLVFLEENPSYVFASPSTILYKDRYTREKKCYNPLLSQDVPVERIKEFLKTYWDTDIVTGLFRTNVVRKMQEIDKYCFLARLPEDVIFMLKYLAFGKAHIITTTHYNKLNNGATRVLHDTPDNFYYTEGYINKDILMKNFHFSCASNIVKALKNDKIFHYYLTKNEIEEASKIIYQNIWLNINEYKYKKIKKSLKVFIKRHPLFFTKKRFYWILKKCKIAQKKCTDALKIYEKIK